MVYDDTLTDEQIVGGLLTNDHRMTEYFFCRKCSRLFSYIVYNLFDGKASTNELVNELYLYLAEDDWRRLRQFDFRSKLTTWIAVVATRYLQKKRDTLIENNSTEALNWKTEQDPGPMTTHDPLERRLDLTTALESMANERYRMVIRRLDLDDVSPEDLAIEMGVTVDNLYNIHRRALKQLRLTMTKKEDYL